MITINFSSSNEIFRILFELSDNNYDILERSMVSAKIKNNNNPPSISQIIEEIKSLK